MFKLKGICYGLLLLFTVTGYGNMKILSLYTVNYSPDTPVINGKLNDGCWGKAEVSSTYYVYNRMLPKPGQLNSELKMLWNERGLYLGITNYERNMSAVRAKYTARDDINLWRDDCGEIYFDPAGNGVGFTKFIINAIGTIADQRRIDAAVTLTDWSAAGVQVATSQDADAWYIEAFFPWNDLGKIAEPGDLWRFCHVRYAWSSGKFVGATSSVGGSYTKPENFGFIYFAQDTQPGIEDISAVLKAKANPPWNLPINDGLLSYNGSETSFKKLAAIYSDHYAAAQKLLKQPVFGANQGNPKVKQLKQRFTELKAVGGQDFSRLRKLIKFSGELDELYWKLKLKDLVENN
ncbi:MAG: carbohydrate-binding family 9-like protein [Victivallaceae bacterium]|nr:carbohydrate-binding family 9-like protein [Victivallaceae bacterium]